MKSVISQIRTGTLSLSHSPENPEKNTIMNKALFIYPSLFLIILLLSNSQRISHTQPDVLSTYGEYIYTREKCAHCHTQHIEEASADLVSLDGLGGKYSDRWLVFYLEDPQSLNPEAKMSGFPHLLVNPISKQTMEQLIKEKSPEKAGNMDLLWSDLVQQSDSIFKNLERDDVAAQSEVLALIAYLQQIASTKTKMERDSMEYAQLTQMEQARQKEWEHELLDENSILLKTAKNQKNASKGAQLYRVNCQMCHGEKGAGSIGPNLTDPYWLHGGQSMQIAQTIIDGVPDMGMVSWKSQLTPVEVGQLVAYIHSLKGSKPQNAKGPQGERVD